MSMATVGAGGAAGAAGTIGATNLSTGTPAQVGHALAVTGAPALGVEGLVGALLVATGVSLVNLARRHRPASVTPDR